MRLTHLVACSVLLAVSLASGQWPESTQPVASSRPGFDPKDVVRQVRLHGSAHEPSAAARQLPVDDGEFLIDTGLGRVPAFGDQGAVATATDGVNSFFVWQDMRGSMDFDIYGCRVSPDGTILDPAGIPISTAPFDQLTPTVAYDGRNYLVAWQDGRSGTSTIFGARVTGAGEVLDPEGVALCNVVSGQREPAASASEGLFLVVWQDNREGIWHVFGCRVLPDGSVLDPSGFPICRAQNSQWTPAATSDGTNFLVVWQDFRSDPHSDIYGARVSPDGALLDTAGFAISTAAEGQGLPSAAFDGVNFLVAWEDTRGGQYADIYGCRVTPQGIPLDPNGIVVCVAGYGQTAANIASDGSSSLVVWADSRPGTYCDIYGSRVTRQGVVLDPSGIAIGVGEFHQLAPAVVYAGGSYSVAWTDERSFPWDDIYGARVTAEGGLPDSTGFAISIAAYDQGRPAAAFDGSSYLVAWHDRRASTYGDIIASRVSSTGAVLDSAGIAITQAPCWHWDPAVARGATDFLVVWSDGRGGQHWDVCGARVTSVVNVLDSSGFVIRSSANFAQRFPTSVAFDGLNFLVVWQQAYSGSRDIYASRVTSDAVVLDTGGIHVATGTDWQRSPVVTFDGTNFLVVWVEEHGGVAQFDIFGARVNSAGTVLDSNGFAISNADYHQWSPTVARGDSVTMVVWTDWRGGQDKSDIYGARVTSTGLVLDTLGIPFSTAEDWEETPSVAFNGTDFLVTWQSRHGNVCDLRGARVTQQGIVLDTATVVSQEGNQWYPALVAGASGQVLLVYQGWAGSVSGRTYNTNRIWGKMNPVPGVAERARSKLGWSKSGATIVRGVLCLADGSSASSNPSWLLDISGRTVMGLGSGANDVSGLSPGVYFIREQSAVSSQHSGSPNVRKVVLTE
jgi:hypothetical protein